MDVSTLPPVVQEALAQAQSMWATLGAWAVSPAAWAQLALIVVSLVLGRVFARRVARPLARRLTPPVDAEGGMASIRRASLPLLALLFPLFAYGIVALGEGLLADVIGPRPVIVTFGKVILLIIAARLFVRDIVTDPFLKVLGKWVLIPLAALYALDLIEPVSAWLDGAQISLGNISFSVLALLRGAVAGALLFWLGRWSNDQSSAYLGKQPMRPATRQLATKAAELAIFGAAFLILMNVMGISLTSLAVIGGAIGVGLGFGLQKIASNFISGVILLLEGQATVGDYVELDGGEAGTIVRMTARATILETFDGRWIVVPNEDFITTRVVNYSDQGSANRYEAEFSVSYDTDITRVGPIIEAAVAELDFVLAAPEAPDCELRGFGDSGIDFALEFWVNGIDDGRNKYTSRVLMRIWEALRDAQIEIPYPHRVVVFKGGLPEEAEA